MNWDDLRVLAAVGRTGSFSAAAPEVGLSHSSVSRRMRALEDSLGARLFTPMANKLLLTALGEELVGTAARMEELAEAASRRAVGRDVTLRGPIRFTTVDATARNLMPTIERFCQRYPEIEIDLQVGQSFANLTRGEADVVLRATNRPPPTYVGRCVASHAFAVCAAPALAARFPEDAPLAAYPWVVWGEGMTDRWMAEHVPEAHVVCRANTALMVEEAVRAGIGVGHVASWGASRSDDFVRIRPPDPSLDLDIWLLTHRDLRTTARVRTFMEFVGDEIREQRARIEGRER
ncbi:MAG: LysR family transcriptional regulator, partial [Myxococcota bacterium]